MSEYDAFAEDFSATRTRAWEEFEVMKEYLHPKDRMVDLGCGNGRFRAWLSEHIGTPPGYYYALDISENLLAIAKENNPGDHFFRGDFTAPLPFGAENFDAVVCIAAFHHILTPAQQKAFLAECARILKPGGVLFLTTWKLPSKYFWSNILHLRFKNWVIPFGAERHPRTYRRVGAGELRRLLRGSGFEVRVCELQYNRNVVALAKKP